MLHNLAQLPRYRGLIHSLVARELKARYRGSVLGFFWSFINPLTLLLIYTFVFKYVMPAAVQGITNYPLFMFCGLLPWTWFASSLMESSGVLIAGSNLIKKVLFPAEILPIVTVTAYSNVYDVYGKLISTFQSDWKETHGDQQVQFSTSFGGSTTQAQNVISGFPADIAALSLVPDIELIAEAGLITHDIADDPEGSIVASSAVVFDVRPGNPLNIDNWDDLAQPGVEILTPDPASSGGARWNIVAAYGASMRGEVSGYEANDQEDAQRLAEFFERSPWTVEAFHQAYPPASAEFLADGFWAASASPESLPSTSERRH